MLSSPSATNLDLPLYKAVNLQQEDTEEEDCSGCCGGQLLLAKSRRLWLGLSSVQLYEHEREDGAECLLFV